MSAPISDASALGPRPVEHEPVEPALVEPVLVQLPGSTRAAAPRASAVPAAADADQAVEATLVLRRGTPLQTAGVILSAADFAAHGADSADIMLVVETMERWGVEIVQVSAASRRVRIRTTIAGAARVFGTQLESVQSSAPNGQVAAHRHRTGPLSIPAALDGIVTAVLGLDDRPQARAQFRTARNPGAVSPRAASTGFTPVQLGELYDFPADFDGTGQTVAIIELGGGFEQADLDTYFGELGVGSPVVQAIGVDGARNEPGDDPQGADGEVLLDIEVVGALSPAATMKVYFAPNTDAGFLDAIAEAAHATPTPAAISISWGQSEDQWTAQARAAFDEALADAVTLGVTVTVAAGDNGSTDGTNDGVQHVDFPASSPHALACGGTSLRASGTRISSETVWNDGAGGGSTGGGVSDSFARPDWQARALVPTSSSATGGRGVPDVAGDADPETGYRVLVDGTSAVYGGTSAVAPLWAALVARMVQALGTPLGLLQPTLYTLTSGFHDITTGNNGAYRAAPGWDACTGLGSPSGEALLAALRAASTK